MGTEEEKGFKLKNITVDGRKRFENANVDVNCLFVFEKVKTEVFQNALAWTGPQSQESTCYYSKGILKGRWIERKLVKDSHFNRKKDFNLSVKNSL